jgi:hypothetical protein
MKAALVWRTGLSSVPAEINSELLNFGFSPGHSAIIHQTVQCASGATASKRNGRLQRSADRCTVRG